MDAEPITASPKPVLPVDELPPPTLEYRRPLFAERLGPSRQAMVSLATYPLALFVVMPCLAVVMKMHRMGGLSIQLTVTLLFGIYTVLSKIQRTQVFADEVFLGRFLRSRRFPRDQVKHVIDAKSNDERRVVQLRLRSGEVVSIRTHRASRLIAALRGADATLDAAQVTPGPAFRVTLPVQPIHPTPLPFEERPRPENRWRTWMGTAAFLFCAHIIAVSTASWWNDGPLSLAQHVALVVIDFSFIGTAFVNRTHFVRIRVDQHQFTISSLLAERKIKPAEIESASIGESRAAMLKKTRHAFDDTEHFDLGLENHVRVTVVEGETIIIDTARPQELLAAILALRDHPVLLAQSSG